MTFTNKEVLNIGWQKTKQSLWFIVAFEILAYAVSFGGMEIFGDESFLGFLLSSLVGFVIASVFLRLSRNEKVDFNTIFQGFSGNKFFHYFIATIITGLFVVAGLILLIVPGIIIAIATCFASFIILDMDKNVPWAGKSFWTAIKESYEMTKGVKWKLFGFFIVLLGINILGVIALVVGLLVTVPVSMISLAVIYDKLKKAKAPSVIVPIESASNTKDGQSSSMS